MTTEPVMTMAEKSNTGQEVCSRIPSARWSYASQRGPAGSIASDDRHVGHFGFALGSRRIAAPQRTNAMGQMRTSRPIGQDAAAPPRLMMPRSTKFATSSAVTF